MWMYGREWVMGADGVLRTAVYVQRVRRDGSLGRWIWKWVTLEQWVAMVGA